MSKGKGCSAIDCLDTHYYGQTGVTLNASGHSMPGA